MNFLSNPTETAAGHWRYLRSLAYITLHPSRYFILNHRHHHDHHSSHSLISLHSFFFHSLTVTQYNKHYITVKSQTSSSLADKKNSKQACKATHHHRNRNTTEKRIESIQHHITTDYYNYIKKNYLLLRYHYYNNFYYRHNHHFYSIIVIIKPHYYAMPNIIHCDCALQAFYSQDFFLTTTITVNVTLLLQFYFFPHSLSRFIPVHFTSTMNQAISHVPLSHSSSLSLSWTVSFTASCCMNNMLFVYHRHHIIIISLSWCDVISCICTLPKMLPFVSLQLTHSTCSSYFWKSLLFFAKLLPLLILSYKHSLTWRDITILPHTTSYYFPLPPCLL